MLLVAAFSPDADWFAGPLPGPETAAEVRALGFDPAAAPDVRRLPAGVAVHLDLPAAGAVGEVQVLLFAHGPLDATGVAADGVLRWADGRTQALKWLVGEQVWPAQAGADGRWARAVPVGTNPDGDLLTGSLLTVPTSWADAPVSLSLTARPGPLQLALGGVGLVPGPERVAPPVASFTPIRPPELLPVRPADRGFLGVREGHLAWEDGSRARFWGVNLVGKGNLPADPAGFADTLADLGFDLVRMHHLDQEGVLPNPRRGQPGEGATDPAALDHFDRTLSALGARGISVVAELNTHRAWLPGEGVPAPDGLAVGSKYVNQVWPAWLEAEKAWARAVWGRTNPHTGRRPADDPTVVLVELSNENSLVVGWHQGALEKLPKPHRDELDRQWSAWLRAKYGDDGRLAAAWAGPRLGGLQTGEFLVLDSVAREPSSRARTELYPLARSADLVAFYAELERAHQQAMARFVREELGFRVPLVCNTSFAVPAADALLADCDVIDVHLYWDPYPESSVLTDLSILEASAAARPLEELAWCQEGKPCILGELQHSYPNPSAQEAPLFWATIASRQDLDAVIWFAWSHTTPVPGSRGPAGGLDLEGRSDALVQMPVASALFRGAWVPAAGARHLRWWSAGARVRDLAEPPGLWIPEQVGWGAALDRVRRTSFSSSPAVSPSTAPDPGPTRWTVRPAAFEVDTPTLRVRLAPGAPALSLASLDGAPLGQGAALLTVAPHAVREGTVRWDGPGPRVLGTGDMGFVDPPRTLRLPWEGPRPRAWALDGEGSPLHALPVRRRDGGWELDYGDTFTPWVRLEARSSPPPRSPR